MSTNRPEKHFYLIKGDLGDKIASNTRHFYSKELLTPSETFNRILERPESFDGLEDVEIKRSSFTGEVFEYQIFDENIFMDREIFIIYE